MTVIVCTGFHRSTTSLTAQILNKSGLHIGDYLMRPNIYNPDGFFEDWPVVQLHDALLKKAGSSWIHTADNPLPNTDESISFLAPYIDMKNKCHQNWGFKDPRTTLFLPVWKKLLGRKGKYIFVFRHWAECLQSIIKRQAANLILSCDNANLPYEQILFWQDSLTAAKMWINYNQKILDFFNENREQCILICNQAQLDGFPLISLINKRFKLNLNTDYHPVIKKEYLSSVVDKSVLNPLSTALKARMDELWFNLNEVADAPGSALPKFKETFLSQSQYEIISQAYSMVSSHRTVPTNFCLLSVENAIEASKFAIRMFDYKLAQEIICFLNNIAPNDFFSLECKGRLYRLLGEYELAEVSFLRAISLKPNPYLYMEIGLLKAAENKIDEAIFFYDQALKRNPKNPSFWIQKSEILMMNSNYDAAELIIEEALVELPDEVKLKHRLAIILERKGKFEQALYIYQNDNTLPLSLKLVCAFLDSSKSYEQAKKAYSQVVTEKCQCIDPAKLLSRIFQHIDNQSSCDLLQHWFSIIWRKYAY